MHVCVWVWGWCVCTFNPGYWTQWRWKMFTSLFTMALSLFYEFCVFISTSESLFVTEGLVNTEVNYGFCLCSFQRCSILGQTRMRIWFMPMELVSISFLQNRKLKDPYFHCNWPVQQLQKLKAVESCLPRGDIKLISAKLRKDPLLTNGMCLSHKSWLDGPQLWNGARLLDSVFTIQVFFSLARYHSKWRLSVQGETPKKWGERNGMDGSNNEAKSAEVPLE